ncbi:sporulation histidine kinase inhibitor Sda [Neobacillus cucumis]|uniref:sporulation histidine kinase inhibitor Sda n=1 Tax=Neobacillus cucumis TaxID=1740721 RepID=UPI002852FD02|nr:sporulation histidine kinase inhibitor Sda [Neobacillus cucumis]MDR4945187.1 sporulation histidine kinase inhibitor Sda [Neobacillus cucumis]
MEREYPVLLEKVIKIIGNNVKNMNLIDTIKELVDRYESLQLMGELIMEKLDLDELRELYEKAQKVNVGPDFINLINNEIKKKENQKIY